MQSLSYNIAGWHAEALLQQLDPSKLMAVISLTNRKDGAGASRHTVVFEHQDGQDAAAETEALVRRLLHERYGI